MCWVPHGLEFPKCCQEHRALRFKQCCQRGYQAALDLVSKVTGDTPAKVKRFYETWVESGHFDGEVGPAEDEVEDDEDIDKEADGSNECERLLASLQSEAQILNEMQMGAEPADVSEDADLDKMPDLQRAFAPPEASQNDAASGIQDSGKLPATLSDALSRPGDFFNALWRLVVKLRSAPGGCDCHWLPNAENVRRASRKLNWHQCLVLKLQGCDH